MAGHNKWSKIKHKKAAGDAQKSRIFGKLSRLISSEAKKAKGDRNAPGLRAAIEKAKRANMPGDNIERAIKKGEGGETASMEAVIYEAYGPGGAALMIEGLTDNRNRAAAEVKHALAKHGFSLAEPGSASWAFEKTDEGYKAATLCSLDESDKEKLSSLIESLEELEDVQEVFTNAE